jgi:hypothetical protein
MSQKGTYDKPFPHFTLFLDAFFDPYLLRKDFFCPGDGDNDRFGSLCSACANQDNVGDLGFDCYLPDSHRIDGDSNVRWLSCHGRNCSFLRYISNSL